MPRKRLPAISPRVKVFVSYSRSDAEVAGQVETLLQEYADTWFDTRNIQPGVEWEQETLSAVTAQDVVVFLVSRHSIDPDRWCIRELVHAQENGKRVACLAIERVPKSDLPDSLTFLRDRQWTNLTDDDWEQRLRLDVEENFVWVRKHTSVAIANAAYRDPSVRGGLLRGAALRNAFGMLAERQPGTPDLTAGQRDFIVRSQRASRWRRGILTCGLVLLLVVAGLVTMRMVTDSRKKGADDLAAKACALAESDPASAMLQAVEAAQRALTPRTRNCLFSLVHRQPGADRYLPAPDGSQILAADSNGDQLAVAGVGGRDVTLWNTGTWQPVGSPVTIAGEFFTVADLAFSPDRTLLAVANSDATINLNRVTPSGLVPLYSNRITGGRKIGRAISPSVAFTPDGRYLLVAGAALTSSQVDVYPVSEWAAVRSVAAEGMQAIDVAPDGTVALWGGGGIRLTRVADVLHDDITEHGTTVTTTEVTAVALALDGSRLAWSAGDPAVHIWNVSTNRAAIEVRHTAQVTALAIGGTATSLAVVGSDQVTLWNVKTGDSLGPTVEQPSVAAATFLGGHNVVATGSTDVAIRTVPARDPWVDQHAVSGAGEPNYGLSAVSPDGMHAAFIAKSGPVVITGPDGTSTRGESPVAESYGLIFLDKEHILINEGDTASTWDLAGHPLFRNLYELGPTECDGGSAPSVPILAAAPGPSPSIVSVGYGMCGLIVQWSADGTASSRTNLTDAMSISAIAANPRTGAVAVADSGTRDTTGQVFLLNGDQKPRTFAVSYSRAVAFAATNDEIAAGGVDAAGVSTVTRIPLSGSTSTSLSALGMEVNAVTFGAGDKLLAAGSSDGVISIWDLDGMSASLLGTVRTGDQSLNGLAFTGSGEDLRFVTAQTIGTVSMRPTDWLHNACTIVGPVVNSGIASAGSRQRETREASRDACAHVPGP